MDKNMTRFFKYLLLGIVVAIGGMFFAELCGDFFNGMDFGSAVTLGIGMYLCIVIVTCTGLIFNKLDKHKDDINGEPHDHP